MTTNTLPQPAESLANFLRDRRARLQPNAGMRGRRRTPGLRREEVATRAGVSVTWYTWLEQGRGGPPSDDVLERLAQALELDATGREVMFLLAQHRPPPIQSAPPPPVTPAVQRVLDAMPTSPALVKTPSWDIVAWNAAARVVLSDYEMMEPRDRNLLRRLFSSPSLRESLPDWEDNARFALAVFRVDVARAGGCPDAVALVDELQAASEEFRRLWAESDARSHGTGTKRVRHPVLGTITLDYASFAVDGAEDLRMLVFTPTEETDMRAIAVLAEEHQRASI